MFTRMRYSRGTANKSDHSLQHQPCIHGVTFNFARGRFGRRSAACEITLTVSIANRRPETGQLSYQVSSEIAQRYCLMAEAKVSAKTDHIA